MEADPFCSFSEQDAFTYSLCFVLSLAVLLIVLVVLFAVPRLLALVSVAGVGILVVVLSINGLLYFVTEVVVSDCLVPISTMDLLL